MAHYYDESDRKALGARSFDGWAFYFDGSTPMITSIQAPSVRLANGRLVPDDQAWFPVFEQGCVRSAVLNPAHFIKIIRWSRLFAEDQRPVIFARVRVPKPACVNRKKFRPWVYMARFV